MEKYEHIGPQSEPDSVQHFTASKCPKCVIKINLFSRLKIHRNHYRWCFRTSEKVKICIRNGRHSNFRFVGCDWTMWPRERVWVRSSMFSRKWTNCCSRVSIFNFRTRFNTSGLPADADGGVLVELLNQLEPNQTRQIAECDDLIPDGMWTHGCTHPGDRKGKVI